MAGVERAMPGQALQGSHFPATCNLLATAPHIQAPQLCMYLFNSSTEQKEQKETK